jgi:hypothetical protein
MSQYKLFVMVATLFNFEILKTKRLGLDSYPENKRLACHAINPFTGKEVPIFLKNNSEFGQVNVQKLPHADARLG